MSREGRNLGNRARNYTPAKPVNNRWLGRILPWEPTFNSDFRNICSILQSAKRSTPAALSRGFPEVTVPCPSALWQTDVPAHISSVGSWESRAHRQGQFACSVICTCPRGAVFPGTLPRAARCGVWQGNLGTGVRSWPSGIAHSGLHGKGRLSSQGRSRHGNALGGEAER